MSDDEINRLRKPGAFIDGATVLALADALQATREVLRKAMPIVMLSRSEVVYSDCVDTDSRDRMLRIHDAVLRDADVLLNTGKQQ